MNIIFLDIDGVICLTTVAGLDTWLPDLENESVDWLKRLCQAGKGDTYVVVSSTWRITVPQRALFAHLGRYDFESDNFHTDWRTPNINDYRGHEIQHWLDEHKREVESYVILDDRPDMDFLPNQRKFLIQTDMANGFKRKHFQLASEVLYG